MEQLQPGQMLGPYRIIDQIGQGGMATVYKAYQASMDRNVAIKVLPSQLANSPEFAQRFQQEARIIAKLEHPHILPVFDYGESDGITYFVMRYLDAGTLSDRMKSGVPLPLNEIDRLFTQLAEALSYAHSYGIVHRDLKPSNAMIDSQGNLFLTDFGIAKLLESASPRLTQTDAIMGTPAYISPEQAQAGKVDQRSDIYSLGIILYEMVTGRVPFVAETPLAVILKHVGDPLPPPSKLKPDIPEAIERVVLKALAKHPEDRYASVAEFLSAWKKALDEAQRETRRAPETMISQPVSARPPLPPPPSYGTPATDMRQSSTTPMISASAPAKTSNYTGWIVGCLVVACVIIGVGGGGFYLYNNSAGKQTPTATAVPLPTDTAVPLPTDTPAITETVAPTVGATLLEDDFSDTSIWGLLDEPDAKVAYDGQSLRVKVFKENWVVWTTPTGDIFSDTHTEVTARNNDGQSTTAFGIICDQQSDNSSYYYAVITTGGEYVIAKAEDGKDDTFFTNNQEWGTSSLIKQNQSSYRVGMDCGSGTLALYVDGELIDSVQDDTFTDGTPGIIVWSGDKAKSADVSFDDYIVTSLP